jgi:SAM-dependent methyltransferase
MSDDGIDWDAHARDAQMFEGWPGLNDTEVFAKLPILGRVLDMGSNICRWYPAFKWLNTLNGHRIEYYAYDRSEQAKDIVRGLYPEVHFSTGEIFDMSQKYPVGFFDTIWCSAFLQHFNNENKEKILAEAHKVLKPTGRFIMTEAYFESGDDDYTNDRVFTMTGWHKFMTKNGFTPLQIGPTYRVYGPI